MSSAERTLRSLLKNTNEGEEVVAGLTNGKRINDRLADGAGLRFSIDE